MQPQEITETAFELFTKQTLVLFQQKESEENWQKFEAQINKIHQITLGSYHISNFLYIMKTKLFKIIVQCLITERTRLARSAMNLVACLAECLGQDFNQLSELLLPSVLKLTTRANKVYVSSATATLKTCVEYAGCFNLIPHLVEGMKNPSKSLRLAAVDVLGGVVSYGDAEQLYGYYNVIENTIATSALDSATEVRELTRSLLDNYKDKFPDRLPVFVSGLTEQAKKYLKVDTQKSFAINTRPIRREDVEEEPKKKFEKPTRVQEIEKAKLEQALDKPIRIQTEQPEKPINTRDIFGKPVAVIKEEPIHVLGKPIAVKPELTSVEKQEEKLSKRESKLPLREGSGLPQRIPAPHFDSSGPQRVAKAPLEQKSKLRPPQRVMSGELITEERQPLKSRSNSVKSGLSTAESIYKPKNTVKNIAQKWAAITSPPKDKQINFQQLQFDASNSDWATRLLVYQQLEKYFQSVGSENIDYKSIPIERSFKIINIGLSDAHFKVVQSCLSCIPAFITSSDLPQAMLDQILPKVFYQAYLPKQKPGILEKSKVIIDMVRQMIPAQLLGQTIANALSSPALLPKVRYGCVGYLTSLEDFELTNLLSKPYTCRIVVCKLVAFLSDNDAQTNKTLKLLFNRINLLLPQNFIYSASALTSSERRLLNNVLGRELEYYSSGRSTPGRNTPSPTGVDERQNIESPTKNRLSNSFVRPDSTNSEITERPRSNTPLQESKVDEIRKTFMGRSVTPPPTMNSFELEVVGKSISTEPISKSPDSKTISNEDEITPTENNITPTNAANIESKSVSPLSDTNVNNLDDELAPPGIDDNSTKDLEDEPVPENLVPPSVFGESVITSSGTHAAKNNESPNRNGKTTITPIDKDGGVENMTNIEVVVSESSTNEPALQKEVVIETQVLKESELPTISVSPSPTRSEPRYQKLSVSNNSSRRSSIKSGRSRSSSIGKATASFDVVLETLKTENSDSQVIRSNIFQLITHMNQHVLGNDFATSSLLLKTVLGLEGKLNEQVYIEVGSAVDAFVAQFEAHFPPSTIMHCVVLSLDQDVSVKICFDIINRTIPKISLEDFATFEQLVVSHIVKALNSSKSAIRKCAFDASFTLLQLKGEEWSEQFYKTVRAGAGVPRENVMRSMMATRLARIANNQNTSS
ncbi:hypothetical protein HDV04_000918 [Boothiomyces sp. JEL0838]|nr:hypothetical protein HDV04_000869 [Boothiomyces sp. JEL0838]KAJ3314195.1 hypothetical protein HDV04_000918 [Boothiomyces sp. JEL0838]